MRVGLSITIVFLADGKFEMNYDSECIRLARMQFETMLLQQSDEYRQSGLFHRPMDNSAVATCFVNRSYEGFCQTEYLDLFLQLDMYVNYLIESDIEVMSV